MALKAASDIAKSYSMTLKQNGSNNHDTKSGTAAHRSNIGREPRGTTMRPQKGTQNKNNPQNKYHSNNKRKPFFNQYKKGTAVASDNSIAAKRPAYLDNKCLVISKVDLGINLEQLQAYVNERAGRQVKFLYEPQNLAKEYSKWRTIAIELNNTDYDLLSSPDFWDNGIRFSDFRGRRHWRNRASNLSPDDRRNSFRQQWEK